MTAISPITNDVPNLSTKGIFQTSGAPSNGTSGTFAGYAPPGAAIVDVASGIVYLNQGTLASPVWAQSSTTAGVETLSNKTINQPVIMGFTNGAAAAAGQLGEEIESSIASGSAVALTSGVSANVTSIVLTPGNWLVYGEIDTLPAAGTTTSNVTADIHTTSATLPTSPNDGAGFNLTIALGAAVPYKGPIGFRQYKVTTNTTVYLVANVSFAVSTLGAYGYLAGIRLY